ncbi:hypothetical protein [Flavivirga jejuensis]|uniref:Uncharacterized protein n=1 Tax=Flavivirga jejuensis TaxID=870487 RepID=A0ABT8WQT1_9FLAO|nr:hypothetical protein [Flavivirga jejuensis]MDO5975515.1 hypothetical protein [Flavivirga jejuensis]
MPQVLLLKAMPVNLKKEMSVSDFFKRVANIKEDEIMKFLKEKEARKQKRKSIKKNK